MCVFVVVVVFISGAVATAEDPSAITTIQSASTFSSEQPIKYLFKTEGAGGQVGELYPPSGQVGDGEEGLHSNLSENLGPVYTW